MTQKDVNCQKWQIKKKMTNKNGKLSKRPKQFHNNKVKISLPENVGFLGFLMRSLTSHPRKRSPDAHANVFHSRTCHENGKMSMSAVKEYQCEWVSFFDPFLTHFWYVSGPNPVDSILSYGVNSLPSLTRSEKHTERPLTLMLPD